MVSPEVSSWLVRPQFGVALTILSFSASTFIHGRSRGLAILNPTFVATLMVGSVLCLFHISCSDYEASVSVITFMLSPAVVLLAVPLFRQRARIRASAVIVAGALAVGLPVGLISGAVLAWLFGAHPQTLLSIIPKSTTQGIALPISQQIGGLPSLTAALVIMTGIVGAVCGPRLLRLLKVDDPRSVGLAIGIASHGIGTARALQLGEVEGAFAGLGMTLNGILTAVLFPLLFGLLF